jgi:transcriptional regulator GlxA family with amidase domain
VDALVARLDSATDEAERRVVLAAYVQQQVALRDGRRDTEVERCVDRLFASEGRVALAELCALAGLGERQLQRRFAEVVGVAPRTLAVVVRLRRVFDALREAPWSTWSERAQAAGFFDHPQMARDFRRLLGRAPSEWAKSGRGLATSLVDPVA